MKNLKYVKLFESFVNEELSPELEIRAEKERLSRLSGDDMLKRFKAQQMGTLLRVNSPKVKELYKRLEDHLKSVADKENNLWHLHPQAGESAKVNTFTPGLTINEGFAYLWFQGHSSTVQGQSVPIIIYPDRVDFPNNENSNSLQNQLQSDRKATRFLEQLVKSIQQDELSSTETQWYQD